MEKIIASPEMATATRLQQFLTYIVEQKLAGADSVKETEVAIAVFNRRSTFDPGGDSVVRVAASNLRHRLRDYYQGTGAQDTLVIDIPKGSYLPTFAGRQEAAPAPRRPYWILAVVAAGIVAAVWFRVERTPPPAVTSIAVLPFLNLGGTPENEELCDALAEEVATSLAQAEGLRVVSRSSAYQFRDKGFDVREAGRRLGADTILEGSVRSWGKRIRINAQLIQAADGFHIWSRVWESDTASLYAIQKELSQSVASVLRYQLRGHAGAPKDPTAYLEYLRAQSSQNRATVADLMHSAVLLRSAIAADPDWAPAHAALADSYASLAYYQIVPDPGTIERAKQAAQTALRLDERSAEAHAVLAWVRYFYDWDWTGSEQGLRRALSFHPNSARALDWLAQRLMSEGRFEEALGTAGKALALDPLSCRASANVAVVLYCARRYEEAIAQARHALRINPDFVAAYTIAGVSLQELRRIPEAEKELRIAHQKHPDDADTLAHLGAVAWAQGRREEAARILDELEHPKTGRPPSEYSVAHLRLAMGRKREAIEALQAAIQQKSSDIVVLKVDPALASLAGDPAFQRLLADLGWRR